MEMKKSLRKTAGIVIISLIIIVLFGTDSNKKVTKEYVLSDKEILGQEAEWELVKSQLPFFAYLLHEKNQDNMYEQFVLHFFPLYHPAAVIYNRSLRDTYLADLAAFAALLRRG